MANRTTINISVTPDFQKFVDAEVASGRYQSASEVFREGLRLLQDREEKRKVALDEVRKKVRQGLEAAKRGELFDGAEVLREILGESRRRREASLRRHP
jgi:antitoxin ParD1/3/4